MNMTCTKTAKAFTLPCVLCGEAEAGINIRTDCLEDDDAQFECRSCGGEFGRSQIDEVLRKWSKMLAWIDLAPDMDAE